MEMRKKDRMQYSTLQKNLDPASHPLLKKQFASLLVRDMSTFIAKHFQVGYRRQKVSNYLYFITPQAYTGCSIKYSCQKNECLQNRISD